MKAFIRTGLTLVMSLAVTVGCATTHQARAYNLETGQVIPATFGYTGSGKGPIQFQFPSGETCSGEYVTLAGGTTAWGSIYGTVYTSYSSAQVDSAQKGSAIATCPDGVVIECEYVTHAWSVQGTVYAETTKANPTN